ncbi:MAG: heavy metal translocating P-type ATPase metal-binding domain-containing protein [Bacteroidetes bacterium]|nr:heavy metal translocating P-type ATPase metal-binding domain-containing protein [Bacteroidota bacterium]
MQNNSSAPETAAISNACYHCGEDCGKVPITLDEKRFCCNGCKTVFEILSQSNACDYYRYEVHPGLKAVNPEVGSRYAYLDNEEIRRELLEFSEDGVSKVKLFIPAIHCSSCIWLLENLRRLHDGVMQSSVNFVKKEVIITFHDTTLSLRQLVELLVSINYIPQLTLETAGKGAKRKINRGIYYRLGVAGFCFGNIMLFSFPAYLSVNDAVENLLRQNFGILNILFGIPVAFYSGSVFIISAWKGLKKRFISIDVPIAIGILVLFFRSAYEIISGTGPGFMDSLAGLVFFLSIGRWYQDKTYQALSFERDYRSYFPVAVTVISDLGAESIIPIKKLKTGMRIMVRNQELVPADALLVKGIGSIDYSFVSGESSPVPKKEGERIFAGGRQAGASIELIVEREVAQSHLTELWNQDMTGGEKQTRWDSILDVISRYFTVMILVLSTVSGIFWWFYQPSMAFLVVTAILIVACPCALAMTYPFSMGGAMRVFGRNSFYLKRTGVVEALSKIDTIVFDKTGTITRNDGLGADFSALIISQDHLQHISSLVRHSTHPASVAIYRQLQGFEALPVTGFAEVPSRGIEGHVRGHFLKIGSAEFVTGSAAGSAGGSRVFVSVDGEAAGFIAISNHYREGMKEVLSELAQRYELHLLSGDNDAELPNLLAFFPSRNHLHFNQSPKDKLEYIRALKATGKKVLMIGDGLNDAGALRESDCGISIADDIYHFSPACDAILESGQFRHLPDFLGFSRTSMRIVFISMGLSFLYNVVGLSFAITGNLSPVVSAILMPLSSVTIVAFVTLSIFISARFSKLEVK